MWIWLSVALATPPSSALTGPNGTLSWTVADEAGGLIIDGKSPKWSVHHACGPDFAPRSTTRSTPNGDTTTITYDAAGATVKLPTGEVRVDQRGLWDGDVLDVRLGAWSAGHADPVSFSAIDSASGKVYAFHATPQGDATHAGGACKAWRVQLGGIYKWVGPTWDYCFAPDGGLVWFSGPIGVFEVTR